jgi:hypothetical protein
MVSPLTWLFCHTIVSALGKRTLPSPDPTLPTNQNEEDGLSPPALSSTGGEGEDMPLRFVGSICEIGFRGILSLS